MAHIEEMMAALSNALWGNWLLFALVGLGIWYTAITGCVQIRRLPALLRTLFKKKTPSPSGGGDGLTSLQALFTALASCVGSGNIVGVGTALLAGGPGALFWMWVAAFFGMATKFGEIILGICYRGKDRNGAPMGGPMFYIAAAFHRPWVGALAAGLLFFQNAGATIIQSNTISAVMKESFRVPSAVTGVLLGLLMLFIISGGLKRLAAVAERVVPVMALLYVAGGVVVILAYANELPAMLGSIFQSAFSLKAGAGALAGITMREAMRFGVARGLYSNEAGEGSAAVVHSFAQVDHPVRQGLYGIAEVFIDTMVICSTTGFAILISGVNLTHQSAATLAAAAFGSVFPAMRYVVDISLLLFCATSLMSQWYFGHVSLTYLKLSRGSSIYRAVFPMLIFLGCMSTITLAWSIQDCALGLLIIPNILALLILSPKVRALTKEFFSPADSPNRKGQIRYEGSHKSIH